MELRAVDLFASIDLEGLAQHYEMTNPKLHITVEKIENDKSDRLSSWLFRVEKGNQLENMFLDTGTPEEAYLKIESRIYPFLKD